MHELSCNSKFLLISCVIGELARVIVGANGNMEQVRRTPEWRAMERATLERTLLYEFAPQDTIRAHMCGHVRAGKPKTPSFARFLNLHHNQGKTQTVRAWDDHFGVGVVNGDTLVKDNERTVGIEVHDIVVGQRNVMVWDHGGQLEVRAHTRLALYE
jgi:hypothetical protein